MAPRRSSEGVRWAEARPPGNVGAVNSPPGRGVKGSQRGTEWGRSGGWRLTDPSWLSPVIPPCVPWPRKSPRLSLAGPGGSRDTHTRGLSPQPLPSGVAASAASLQAPSSPPCPRTPGTQARPPHVLTWHLQRLPSLCHKNQTLVCQSLLIWAYVIPL